MMAAGVAAARPADQVDASVLTKAKIKYGSVGASGHGWLGVAGDHKDHGIPDIDSIPNFTGSFTADGFDQSGNAQTQWVYAMVGSPPKEGGFTLIDAPVIPVSLDLLAEDGTVRYHYDVTPFVWPTLVSPIFLPHQYTSSRLPTQYTDAIQRAEFFSTARPSWHTWLLPRLGMPQTMRVPYGQYQFALNPDGTCCQFVLVNENTFTNSLFPPTPTDTTTIIGSAENTRQITTKSIATFLFPNTFLYDDAGGCCVLGFHSYDAEPGDARNRNREKRYVINYSSWVSPGLFGPDFQDITALSHELAELFNDPFVASDGVHNIVPWWLSGPLCDDTNEVGDVIEVLADLVFPIEMSGMTYHPQNEALLPWFARESQSSAIHHAYSYPDESALPALSAPQQAFCAAPPQ